MRVFTNTLKELLLQLVVISLQRTFPHVAYKGIHFICDFFI